MENIRFKKSEHWPSSMMKHLEFEWSSSWCFWVVQKHQTKRQKYAEVKPLGFDSWPTAWAVAQNPHFFCWAKDYQKCVTTCDARGSAAITRCPAGSFGFWPLINGWLEVAMTGFSCAFHPISRTLDVHLEWEQQQCLQKWVTMKVMKVMLGLLCLKVWGCEKCVAVQKGEILSSPFCKFAHFWSAAGQIGE